MSRYPIVARRARPTGLLAFRPSASCEQRYIAFNKKATLKKTKVNAKRDNFFN